MYPTEKIEEAKKLLTLTNHSLLDISTLLNFNNQSYFTKVFKEYTGITPKQYRNQYSKS
ncbi:helix-turn-helix domain-containing protein [Bacillus thuringiensis]|uniref:helix-turn-helix domain-containing protein n=1 Tax=Bacillus thuringiensis TaxID=1428 RepID=UPI001D010437